MTTARVPRERRRAIVIGAVPYVVAAAATLWLFRATLDGRLLGDIGDARWTISFHEHWYDMWRGRASIRDLSQFYPFENMLGSTDPLFAQGQVYSAARFVGFGLIDSWVIAQIATYAFGVVGLACLARRFLTTWWAQAAFVLAAGVSYPVTLQSGHVQLLAIFWPSWIVLAIADLVAGRATRRSWFVLCTLPPVLALSSWYVLVLSSLTGLVFAGALAVFRARRAFIATAARALRRHLRDGWVIASLVLGAFAWAFAAWIFLAGSGALPDPAWHEVTPFAPRWSDMLDASGQGGGVWAPLYRSWYPGSAAVTIERREGFVPILFVALVACTGLLLRSLAVGRPGEQRRAERMWLLALALTCFLVPILFVTSEDGLSLFKPLWLYVPGLDSIRAPFRVMGIIYAIAVFVVVRSVEAWATTRRGGQADAGLPVGRLGLAGALLLSLIVETNREPHASWRAEDIVRPAVRQWIPEIRSQCDALILLDEDPSDPDWVLAIDAVMLSTLARVPTPQGYGRAGPIGFPGSGADPASLDGWMRSHGFEGRSCTVSSHAVERLA